MRRRKLRPYVLPTFLVIGIVSIMLGVAMLQKILLPEQEELPTSYVTNTIFEEEQPVINETTKILNPYLDENVTIGKNYYDYKADSKTQENSIIYHDNTYMQNSGVDFVNKNTFDVISILEGSVTDVKEDETLGKVIEIKHDNNYISLYQSLSEVSVKKGDMVKQGQVIGKSGTNELDKELGNHLHFELYLDGQVVNPTLYLNKELKTSDNKEQ